MGKTHINKHIVNAKIIEFTAALPDASAPENQKKIYDAFRNIVKAGTNDDESFIKYMNDTAGSFVNPELRIFSYSYAAQKSINGSAFQERMMKSWAEQLDNVTDIYEKILFAAKAADYAENDTEFCFFATDKWVESVEQLKNKKLIVHTCNQTLDETKNDGFAEGGVYGNRHFTFKVRELKRKYTKEIAKENALLADYGSDCYTAEKTAEMARVAKACGYKIG